MADYGLDPSIVGYLQGGGMPPGNPPPIVPTDPPPAYGLPPSVVAGVQNGFAPQQIGVNGGTGTDETSGAPDVPVPSATGGQLQPSVLPAELQPPASTPVASPSPAPMQGGADYVIGTAPAALPTTPAEVAKSNAVVAKTQAANAAFQASPEGVAQKADAENRAAIDKERVANADASAAEQAQNTATAASLQAHADRQAKQDAIDAARTAQDRANTDKYTQIYAQQVKDAADYKVNTDRSVGTRGLIAIALSGIGQALDHNHGPNAALEIINADMDKRIADQWAQKKALGEKAAGTKDVLGVYRNNADDDRQSMQFQKAAESTRLADDIRQVGAQYANPAAKARAEAIAAGLDQKAASITMSEAQRKAQTIRDAQEQANKQAQLGVAYGELGLRRQEHKDQVDENDRNFAVKVAELEAAGNNAQAAALQKQHDEINELGMYVPTGVNPDKSAHYDPVTNQDGTPWLAPKGDPAKELGKIKSGTIDGVKQIDDLYELRKQFGSTSQLAGQIASTEEGRKMLQKQAKVILDLHEASGINRFSGEIVDISKKILTGGIDADSARAMLDELPAAREMMLDGLDANMRGQGNYTGRPMATYFPDPAKAAPTAPLGVQLTQPFVGTPTAPERIAPQRNAPSVIDNFGRAPGRPTVAPASVSPTEEFHKYVMKELHKK